MYEACLFDYGNTLVAFDRPQIAFVLERLVAELGRRFGRVEALLVGQAMDRLYDLPRAGPEPTYRELSSEEQMTILLDDLYGPAERPREEVRAADAALQEAVVESIVMDPEHRATLERIAARVPVGLVSNYPSAEAIRRSLERVGIHRLFRAVVISGEVGLVKPHPRLFQEALSALRARPERTLFVGDRWDADLCGARDAGLRSCHMLGFTSEGGFEDRYRIYRPDHVARSLDEVAALLELE